MRNLFLTMHRRINDQFREIYQNISVPPVVFPRKVINFPFLSTQTYTADRIEVLARNTLRLPLGYYMRDNNFFGLKKDFIA